MKLVPEIQSYAADLTAIRRDLHAHPEIGFEEHRTADRVAELLESWGVTVHRAIGTTGVVGVINGVKPGRTIGLRADMDALPMTEATGAAHASTRPGVFHGCGHDGHTTMLLGAARYLAQQPRLAGRVVLIFQPAEEGLGGAARMIEEGLFDRFPCDEIYALHNWPNAPLGQISLKPGVAMAAADSFDVVISGRGAHGAQPQNAVDPVVVAAALTQALQTIVSRNVDPLRAAILSVTQIHAGSAYNVIPDTARLSGTIRTFAAETRNLVLQQLEALSTGIASAFGAAASVQIDPAFPFCTIVPPKRLPRWRLRAIWSGRI
ncbi:amidohydrolase [Gemmobacter lanyuensis]